MAQNHGFKADSVLRFRDAAAAEGCVVGENSGIVQRAPRVHETRDARALQAGQAVRRAEQVAAGQQGDGQMRNQPARASQSAVPPKP